MTLLRLVVPCALFAGALSACSQPDDVPRLQEEATVTVKAYQLRFDELDQRAQAIKPDGLTGDTQRTYQQATASLVEYKNLLRQKPLQIQAGGKEHETGQLQRLIDELHERFEDGVVEVNTELTAVESQLALTRHGLAPAPAAPPAARVQAGDGTVQRDDAPVQ